MSVIQRSGTPVTGVLQQSRHLGAAMSFWESFTVDLFSRIDSVEYVNLNHVFLIIE